ncbi:TM2 domain-containing protein [Defluviitalea raffinosedens]|nr:TM2 domain-containing protein [Defluviitalea raffinosedens]MBM7684623.1 TM2 domain-containing membrane protein YozV [Defluviitalea raffinosedens]
MNCYVHLQKEAVGTCVGCGKFICEECNTEISGKNYCKKCISELINENKKKIEKLEENTRQQPMVFMNAGGGASSSSSSSSGGNIGRLVPTKSKLVAGLLAIFFGGLGIHKFYLGRLGTGILYLIFCWTCIPFIIGFIEGIIYLCTSEEVFAAKYGGRYI